MTGPECYGCGRELGDVDEHDVDGRPYHPECCPAPCCSGEPMDPIGPDVLAGEVSDGVEVTAWILACMMLAAMMLGTITRVLV